VNIDRGRPLSPVLDECITTILSQVRLLRQISAEFSSFASTATAHPAPTDVAELIEEVVGPYRLGLSGRISIEVTVPHALPPLQVDRTLLARAITNVMENALHAMPGTGSLRIVVGRELASPTLTPTGSEGGGAAGPGEEMARDAIVIEMTDTGVGMDTSALARIFEPYFSTKATGTGLGLTIAKRNVELNGGTVAVHSEKGVGTTVTMTFPL
jgi:two-component system nitrogen regulation sensor histidine kinase NtrY